MQTEVMTVFKELYKILQYLFIYKTLYTSNIKKKKIKRHTILKLVDLAKVVKYLHTTVIGQSATDSECKQLSFLAC